MPTLAVPLVYMSLSAASLFIGFKLIGSVVAGFFLYYVACCLVLPLIDLLAIRRIALRRIPALIGFRKLSRADIALGLGSGLLMVAILVLALVLLKDPVFGDGTILAALKDWGVPRERIALVYSVMLAFNGAIEECFWRGYLHERLASVSKRFVALGLPALFFGGQHLFVISSIVADPVIVALFLFGILGAGAIWGLIREKTKSLLPCVLSHMLVTAGYMGIFFIYTAG